MPLATFIAQGSLGSILNTKTKAGRSAAFCTQGCHVHPAPPMRHRLITYSPQSKKDTTYKLIKKTGDIRAYRHIEMGSEKPTRSKNLWNIPEQRVKLPHLDPIRRRTPNSVMALACYLTTQLCSKGPIGREFLAVPGLQFSYSPNGDAADYTCGPSITCPLAPLLCLASRTSMD